MNGQRTKRKTHLRSPKEWLPPARTRCPIPLGTIFTARKLVYGLNDASFDWNAEYVQEGTNVGFCPISNSSHCISSSTRRDAGRHAWRACRRRSDGRIDCFEKDNRNEFGKRFVDEHGPQTYFFAHCGREAHTWSAHQSAIIAQEKVVQSLSTILAYMDHLQRTTNVQRFTCKFHVTCNTPVECMFDGWPQLR